MWYVWLRNLKVTTTMVEENGAPTAINSFHSNHCLCVELCASLIYAIQLIIITIDWTDSRFGVLGRSLATAIYYTWLHGEARGAQITNL